ncbi:Uncharacterised protein [Klebsiella michiganensis]|uniref:Uncharacterized protein n=1 Tax=Klebsiella michiganensis TaxID=1134687 RepID=A0A7H4MVI9_9ENTR|nr:Uncharacterised protein [Klebsiella michiganensis]
MRVVEGFVCFVLNLRLGIVWFQRQAMNKWRLSTRSRMDKFIQ